MVLIISAVLVLGSLASLYSQCRKSAASRQCKVLHFVFLSAFFLLKIVMYKEKKKSLVKE